MTDGAEQQFDAFYDATYRRTVGQIFAVTGSMAEAEDAAQEAYARAWQRWDRLDEQPEVWVRVVAHRLAVSSWRKSVNRLVAHRREYSHADEPAAGAERLAIIDALRRIPRDQRVAIVLYHYVGLSVQEIAAHTGTRTGTVKARLARGRKALVPHLSEPGDSGEPRRPTSVNAATALEEA